MNNLSNETGVPAWYAFIYDPEAIAFRFAVRSDVVACQRKMSRPDWLVSKLAEVFRVDELCLFDHQLQDCFGFGTSIKKVGEKESFLIYEAKIPKVRCDVQGGRCDYHDFTACALSISLLLSSIEDAPTQGMMIPFQQGIVLRLGREPGRDGKGISGKLSQYVLDAVPLILGQSGFSRQVRQAMAQLWKYLHAASSSDPEHAMIARSDDGKGFTFSCPGSETTLHTVNSNLTYHNVNSFEQQLTLLAGLGMFYRAYLKKIGSDIL